MRYSHNPLYSLVSPDCTPKAAAAQPQCQSKQPTQQPQEVCSLGPAPGCAHCHSMAEDVKRLMQEKQELLMEVINTNQAFMRLQQDHTALLEKVAATKLSKQKQQQASAATKPLQQSPSKQQQQLAKKQSGKQQPAKGSKSVSLTPAPRLSTTTASAGQQEVPAQTVIAALQKHLSPRSVTTSPKRASSNSSNSRTASPTRSHTANSKSVSPRKGSSSISSMVSRLLKSESPPAAVAAVEASEPAASTATASVLHTTFVLEQQQPQHEQPQHEQPEAVDTPAMEVVDKAPAKRVRARWNKASAPLRSSFKSLGGMLSVVRTSYSSGTSNSPRVSKGLGPSYFPSSPSAGFSRLRAALPGCVVGSSTLTSGGAAPQEIITPESSSSVDADIAPVLDATADSSAAANAAVPLHRSVGCEGVPALSVRTRRSNSIDVRSLPGSDAGAPPLAAAEESEITPASVVRSACGAGSGAGSSAASRRSASKPAATTTSSSSLGGAGVGVAGVNQGGASVDAEGGGGCAVARYFSAYSQESLSSCSSHRISGYEDASEGAEGGGSGGVGGVGGGGEGIDTLAAVGMTAAVPIAGPAAAAAAAAAAATTATSTGGPSAGGTAQSLPLEPPRHSNATTSGSSSSSSSSKGQAAGLRAAAKLSYLRPVSPQSRALRDLASPGAPESPGDMAAASPAVVTATSAAGDIAASTNTAAGASSKGAATGYASLHTSRAAEAVARLLQPVHAPAAGSSSKMRSMQPRQSLVRKYSQKLIRSPVPSPSKAAAALGAAAGVDADAEAKAGAASGALSVQTGSPKPTFGRVWDKWGKLAQQIGSPKKQAAAAAATSRAALLGASGGADGATALIGDDDAATTAAVEVLALLPLAPHTLSSPSPVVAGRGNNNTAISSTAAAAAATPAAVEAMRLSSVEASASASSASGGGGTTGLKSQDTGELMAWPLELGTDLLDLESMRPSLV